MKRLPNRAAVLGICVAAAACPPASASPALNASAAQPDLTWQWAEGDRRLYQTEATTRHTTEIGRKSSTTTSTLRFETVQDVRSVTGSGIATVDQTVGPVHVEVDHPDLGRITADGTNADPFARLNKPERQQVEPYVRLGGSAVTFEIDKDGEVISASGGLGADAISAALGQLLDAGGGSGGLGGGLGGGLSGGLSGGGVTTPSHIQQSLALVPNRPVSRGDRWSTIIEQSLPLIGEMQTTIECRYAGETSSVAGRVPRVTFDGNMEFGTTTIAGVITLELEQGTMRGELAFDPEVGQIVSMQSTTTMVWRVTTSELLSDSGEAEEQKVTLEQSASWRLKP